MYVTTFYNEANAYWEVRFRFSLPPGNSVDIVYITQLTSFMVVCGHRLSGADQLWLPLQHSPFIVGCVSRGGLRP